QGPDSLAESIIIDFTMYEDQERAFKIMAGAVTNPGPEPLRMLVTGIAGSGKSTVINGFTEFLMRRNEKHRILKLAPTGTAASLIGGQTYHSVL
ncbi:hypothetical protein BCR33DRAFT_647172, partial [Rhizoclosmatium globosum]